MSASLVGLGVEFATNLGLLAAQGCTVTVSIVQEIENPEEDRLSIGIELTPAALAWLGASGASLVIDQYLG